MSDNDFSVCKPMESSPSWGLIDVFIWKVVSDKFGGGIGYIQKFKDAWVIHNKNAIRTAAERYSLPVELMAGVCWIEVGGDRISSTGSRLKSEHLTGAALLLSIAI
jgi:hypothetical protein